MGSTVSRAWFIANNCGTGLLRILSKGLIVFIFFRVKRKSIILSYIYIVFICIGYVIKENEIVKNDIKCLFEGKTRRCLMGSTVSRAWFIANNCGTGLLRILSKGLIVFIFFRVKRKKNLWINKPKRRKNCDVL
jgi:Na+/phosphate symporter